MYKDTPSKLQPNKLLHEKQDEYVKPSRVKTKIKSRPVLTDTTNKLESMQNYVKPVEIDLQVEEEEIADEDELKEGIANVSAEGQGCEMGLVTFQEGEKCADQSGVIQKVKKELSLKSDRIKQKAVQSQYNDENMDPKQQARLQQQANLAFKRSQKSKQKSKKKSFPKKKRSIQEIVESRKMAMLKIAENNRKLFNLDIESSSENEAEKLKQLDQNKNEDFHLAKKLVSHDNQIQNIFQQEQKKKGRKNLTKFEVNLSDEDSDTPQNENQVSKRIPQQPVAKKRNLILSKFDSDSENEKEKDLQQNIEKIGSQQFQDELQLIRNMNIQKLKAYFQYLNIDKNYFAFCSIPAESKISLIVKRNTQKSQYLVFDSQLVCQIGKVQKSIGGVYRFYTIKDFKDGKSQKIQVGKMKSNFIGTQFHCYAYKDSESKQKKQKYQCLSITYDVNILGLNGPRKIKMYTAETPLPSTTSLLETYSSSITTESSIKLLQSKVPKWMAELNAYVLNLRGTASHSSIKNCVIVDSNNENKQYLIFGKKSKDIFNLEIKHPLTLFQGIAFAVSSFEKKLACQ